ncbi:phospholipid/cholesterol/gamma-HCH transport system permease protein [Halopseudomonas litoralis]|uniref:Phospholipid/cholesterol/gamma-HCH transport system permease protein n=1 Tax=Halopseudomonas litoralis TaxID=797277 RepID=A0A1H1UG83_9GAMM|nr:ABC transporter permease [Halopseudomonas litoralis]SDS71196.1 phospholipid/cholesterol/gamma-HCH transport system permease protein [Halopseudomonas litoralis]
MPEVAENRFVSRSPDNPAHVVIRGDWILEHYSELRRLVRQLRSGDTRYDEADLQQVGKLDTAGGQLLTELLGSELIQVLADDANALPEERRVLLSRIADSLDSEPRPQLHDGALLQLLGNVGKHTLSLYDHVRTLLGFGGLTLAGMVGGLLRPSTWRVTSIVAQIEQIALNAVAIVALLTFMVGAVIAFLGATVLADFGATIYTVDLIAFSFLREFAVLLTAILMAGRTASAFTAQIGSMKANEEIDAIRTLGLNPLHILVIPRVIAMMISLPVLTFIGMLSGMLGGAVVCSLALDISPTMFLSILQQNVAVQHFYLGMAKAPLFAFLIAIIGCMEGFKVSGSAESVGEHTTSAVVQSIFVVILMDALAALFFMEMNW